MRLTNPPVRKYPAGFKIAVLRTLTGLRSNWALVAYVVTQLKPVHVRLSVVEAGMPRLQQLAPLYSLSIFRIRTVATTRVRDGAIFSRGLKRIAKPTDG